MRIAALLIALAALVPLHLAWRFVRLRSPWPRIFLGLSARIVGARPRLVGTPLRRDVVFVANHQSWTDIPLIAEASGCAFVATSELAEVPLIGWLCGLNRTVFVRRDDRFGVTAQIAALRAALPDARVVTIFPEGTTGRALLPFKAALLAMLDPAPAGVRVQPVRIDYDAATADVVWIGDETGIDHGRRLLSRRGGFPATVHFLAPFDPAEIGGRKAIAAEARRRIAAAGSSAGTVPPTAAGGDRRGRSSRH